jgi:hypothetical protein
MKQRRSKASPTRNWRKSTLRQEPEPNTIEAAYREAMFGTYAPTTMMNRFGALSKRMDGKVDVFGWGADGGGLIKLTGRQAMEVLEMMKGEMPKP